MLPVPRSYLSGRAGEGVVEVAPVGPWVDRARLDSGEVQQVVHQTGEAVRLGLDRRQQRLPVILRHRVVPQAAGGGGDHR